MREEGERGEMGRELKGRKELEKMKYEKGNWRLVANWAEKERVRRRRRKESRMVRIA